jgi:hypothetical protein
MLAACNDAEFFEAVRNNLRAVDPLARVLALATEAIADSNLTGGLVSKFPTATYEHQIQELTTKLGKFKKPSENKNKCQNKLNLAIEARDNTIKLRDKLTADKQREAELITEVLKVAHTLTISAQAAAANPPDDSQASHLVELATNAAAIEEGLKTRWNQENIASDEDLLRKYTEYSADMKQELISAKYFIAGGSARWMFSLSETEAMDEVKLWIGKIPNYEHLLSGVVGDNSVTAVNHLLARDEHGEHYLQSRYAMLQMARKAALKLISLARSSAMRNNPAWMGWVFQLEFFALLYDAIQRKHALELQH